MKEYFWSAFRDDCPHACGVRAYRLALDCMTCAESCWDGYYRMVRASAHALSHTQSAATMQLAWLAQERGRL